MSEDRQIVSQVYEAKTDSDAADRLVRQYMGFIKAETGKFSGRVAVEGRDDELSIAMLAFYETILAYDKSRGAFLPLAAIAIHTCSSTLSAGKAAAPPCPATLRRQTEQSR